jgi:prephenate dehydrogenase
MKLHTLTIVGVGLLGGSIGLAAKRRGLAEHVLGTGRTQAGLDRACELGAIDAGTLDVAAAVRQAEVAVFCTPVDRIPEQVLETAPGCRPGTLLTDVGSTKCVIVGRIEGRLPRGVAFVGSHPLAGSEKRGAEFADTDLFQGRVTVVTPTRRTDPKALEKTTAFWQALGSQVRVMGPKAHDEAVALTSHLPHMAAAALAGVLPRNLYGLTATGFRDTTRVAAGDPSLWTAILRQNRVAVLHALNQFKRYMSQFRLALEADDPHAIDALLTQAKKVRDALGN